MTTLSTYQQISNNLTRWQTLTTKTPAVQTAVSYYTANIGKVTSINDFIGNTRLFTFAMNAFGLSDLVNAKALVRKVLEGGTTSSTALANTLNNPNLLAFAKTFDFAGSGSAVTSSQAATTDVVSKYVEQTLETTQGQSNKGVQLALYFQRNAANITSPYDILADKSLLTVVQTTLGISPLTSSQNVDVQAANLKKVVDFSTFTDPKKLNAFIARFSAQYDVAQSTSAASTAASSGLGLSTDLLLSLQGLRLGG